MFSWPGNLWSGIANVPATAPDDDVIIGLPAMGVSADVNPAEGVTNCETATPSKKA